MKKMTFALFFGNRGFFPGELIARARQQMTGLLKREGYGCLMAPEDQTRFGAVETPAEGRLFARFLAGHRTEVDGVILCLPNFGDETGAVAALQEAGIPILITAWPDTLDKMDMSQRRDAFCGKFSIMDVFYQYGIPYTPTSRHVMDPASPDFAAELRSFAAVCRTVRGMKKLVLGAIGARTSAFKTVRYDELALQKYGITTEVADLSALFRMARQVEADGDPFRRKREHLLSLAGWQGVPDTAVDALARLGIALDVLIETEGLQALALRCWLEIEQEFGVSPCVLLGDLNDRGLPAACELDVCNAVAMRALSLASERPAACLDWNNNYGNEPDKCILFHCGPVAPSLMQSPGTIVDHPMFAKTLGPGHGFGCNTGRIAPGPFTFASAKTEDGVLSFYLGEGEFTGDPIPDSFFGCAGTARIEGLEEVLAHVGRHGYRHHVSITPGHVKNALAEAITSYLGYTITRG